MSKGNNFAGLVTLMNLLYLDQSTKLWCESEKLLATDFLLVFIILLHYYIV